jgi:cyclophilin family peptidyl-prolyl cis-trans isomerase
LWFFLLFSIQVARSLRPIREEGPADRAFGLGPVGTVGTAGGVLMSDRTRGGANARRGARRPVLEELEGRQLLAATLAPIGPVQVPATVGFQLPLQGGTDPQTFAVTSDNPAVQATVAQGKFLTIGVNHASSGAGDPAFTGSLTFQLFDDLTPLTTSRIESLVQQGFYTSPTTGNNPATGQPFPSKNFHRVVVSPSPFVVQGGSQTGNGSGALQEPGFPFLDEYNPQLVYTGTGQLAMANAGNDTNDSQFFVTLANTRNLDFNKTIFGQLVAGQTTLNQMAGVARTTGSNGGENSMPTSPILITSATLSNTNPNGVVHISAVTAQPGQTAHLTITATDTATGQATSQTVPVTVTPNVDASGNAINEQPFLLPVQNVVVGTSNGTPQKAVFQLHAFDSEPTDTLTYQVGSGTTTDSTGQTVFNTTIPNATATVDANGIVQVTPNAGFTGTINLLVGVRDQVNHQGNGTTIDNINNFSTHKLSVTVTNGAPVNLPPIAINGTAQVTMNTPKSVQLAAIAANPGSGQTVTYSIVTPPLHGTITNFNANTGSFTYTPATGFSGTDAVSFQVRDVGAPTPNLDSNVAVETLNVAAGATGAVRLIGNVLVVTPLPRTDGGTNTILIGQSNGNLQVTVNGITDSTQPAESNVDQIVAYGSKASDTITVAPDVTVPATIDGGHGGTNFLTAGGASALMHGWFGRTTLQGAASDDVLIGRAGLVRFRPSGGNDILFAAARNQPRGLLSTSTPTRGTFYKFVNGRLVPTKPPKFPATPHLPTPPGKTAATSAGGPPFFGGGTANGGSGPSSTGSGRAF